MSLSEFRSVSRVATGGSGVISLALAITAAAIFFREGFLTLAEAWQLPEYSHGPLIPVLSGLLFLRQLKDAPSRDNLDNLIEDRWPGVAVLIAALALALVGKLSGIGDVVAYALIVWVGGMLLTGFGWSQGKRFWPSVLHLVFMLPLPGLLYYKASTTLQFVSSELGVWFLQLLNVPVFLDGNIIDLGVYKLFVAEACSGLRYVFPIMSFSYIFAILYRGPAWHKATLLLSAMPIAVVMNSVRIALIGLIVNNFGIEHVEGLTHLMEGWVVFLACILVLLGLASLLLVLQSGPRMSLTDALDLDLRGVLPQFLRLRLVRPSAGLVTAALITGGAAGLWHSAPARDLVEIERSPLAVFPRDIGKWSGGAAEPLSPKVARALGADDYLSRSYNHPDLEAPVSLFTAWYADQTKGGIHSPEVCLPGGGWDMQSIETIDVAGFVGASGAFPLNRVIIQKGMSRLLVYFWFDQGGRKIASDYAAKAMLLWSGLTEGRTDGALVRLITPILAGESVTDAEIRLQDFLASALEPLPRFVNGSRRNERG